MRNSRSRVMETQEYNWENHKILIDLNKSFSKQTNASLKLASQILSSNNSNVVCSPVLIKALLCLIASGSQGPLLDQLLSFLKSSSIQEVNQLWSKVLSVVMSDGTESGGPKISVAYGAWFDQRFTLQPSFKQIAGDVFKTDIFHVDFQTKAKEVAAEANSWVNTKTNGLIKNVFSPDSFSSYTQLILANCLYFKGSWDKEFDPKDTKDDRFYLLDGTSVKASYMTNNREQIISVNDGFKVLQLPYKGGYDMRRFSMYILLPDARDGLPSLIEEMGSQTDFLNCCIPTKNVEIGEFKIPKFKISFGLSILDTIKTLGVSSLEDPGALNKMVESLEGEDIQLYGILQKSFIEVNEKGTEAASVCIMSTGACLPPPVIQVVDFVADHPFMFMIQENISGVILFTGHVMNPTEEH